MRGHSGSLRGRWCNARRAGAPDGFNCVLLGLLALVAGAALMVFYQERRSRVLLADLRAAIRRISPITRT